MSDKKMNENVDFKDENNILKMNERLTRKGQSEALGLAIVVLLIIVGFLLLIVFSGGDRSTKEHENYLEKLSSNTLYAMLNMDVRECRTDSFQDVIKDCVNKNNFITCSGNNWVNSSCEYMNQTIKRILDLSIGEQADYYMHISTLYDVENEFCNYQPCRDKSRPYKQTRFTLPSGYGQTNDISLKVYLS